MGQRTKCQCFPDSFHARQATRHSEPARSGIHRTFDLAAGGVDGPSAIGLRTEPMHPRRSPSQVANRIDRCAYASRLLRRITLI